MTTCIGSYNFKAISTKSFTPNLSKSLKPEILISSIRQKVVAQKVVAMNKLPRFPKENDNVSTATSRRDVLGLGLYTYVSLCVGAYTPTAKAAGACEMIQAGDLQYCDIKVGSGREVKSGDTVEMVYQGADVLTRDVYDTSPADEPLMIVAGDEEVIIGWDKGIIGKDGMPPVRYGGVRKLIVPAKLAYGSEGYACVYDSKSRGGMRCTVQPGGSVEIVFKVLE
mmetsp:Transcript_29810/g.41196  ORF Transcript_29810/g.41196 Transcript_29810/m.41196 type:complete len:224 (+) Transcript_29810:72-743(+)|eukprot:CAMPEP_0196581446 /NCGR_PEP_ID=MMETSP1081-20130531/33968_1 /TAXON_ID=36882 /ORGANISM="Pyramimonas amylifera, Strain CCMP720" /LENGTH=223 /DNA_ID=CAMNT_0041901681 /DNA_START=72 /DNA_END=743 /DNA_ORIENTATION=+